MGDFSIADILARGYQAKKNNLEMPYGISNVAPVIGNLVNTGVQVADQNRQRQSVLKAQQDYAGYLSTPADKRGPAQTQRGLQAGLALGFNVAPKESPAKTRIAFSNEVANAIRKNAGIPPSDKPLYEDEVAGLKAATPKTTDDPMKTAKMWQSQINNIIPTIAKRGSPLGIAAVNNQKKDRLLEIASHPNLTPQEIRLLEVDLAGVMQGGSPQEDTLRATHYGNYYQDWASFKGKFTGTAEDAKNPEIVSKLKSLALGVGSVDNKVITDNISMIENYPSMTYLIKKDPEGWSNFKKTMMGTLVTGDITDSPPATNPVSTSIKSVSEAGGPKPGDVKMGYKFKGGDQYDQANWIKQ